MTCADADGFATSCYEFDRVSKLDAWKTSILVKIKRTIEDSSGVGGGGGGGDGGGEDDDIDLT